MWSSYLSLVPGELPPEGVAELSDRVISDFSLDFDNYTGAVFEEVDGERSVVIVARDLVENYYVVRTFLEPEIVSSVSLICVG